VGVYIACIAFSSQLRVCGRLLLLTGSLLLSNIYIIYIYIHICIQITLKSQSLYSHDAVYRNEQQSACASQAKNGKIKQSQQRHNAHKTHKSAELLSKVEVMLAAGQLWASIFILSLFIAYAI
jgi:hypothetical protein